MTNTVTVKSVARRASLVVRAVTGAAASMLQGGITESWATTVYPRERIAVLFQDAAGSIFAFINGAGRLFVQHIEVQGEISGPMIDAGQVALGRAIATQSRPHNLPIPWLAAAYNLVLGYGQSLMAGQVGQPGIPMGEEDGDPNPCPDNARMIGASTRPQGVQEGAFWPIGITRASYGSTMATYVAAIPDDSILTQLQGTTLTRDAIRTAVLDQSAVEALTSGDVAGGGDDTGGYEGQDPVTAFTAHLAGRLQRKNPFAGQLLIGANSAAGGRTFEQLSKVAPGGDFSRWPRLTDARDIVAAIADAETKTAEVAGIVVNGGHFNWNKFDDDPDGGAYQLSSYPYADLTGTWAQSAADVEAVVQQLGADLQADMLASGQTLPPALFFEMASGRFVRDNAKLGVAMGTLNAVLKNRERGWFCTGADYGPPDWGGHMMANGYRWRGAQLGKIMARVLVDRLAWDPFCPYLIEYIGNRVYVHFSPPVPPIRQTPFYGTDGATNLYDDWGCRIEKTPDAGDWLSLDDFRVLGGCILSFRCSEAPTGTSVLWMGDQDEHQGGTNVADSDETTIEQVYTMTSWMTLEDAGDLAALVGKRYPLQNYAVNFYGAMGWTRPEPT